MPEKFFLLRKSILFFAICILPLSLKAQDGSLDISFGKDGIVTTGIDSNIDLGNGVAIQDDGKILVIGNSQSKISNEIALLRYQPNGSLDKSFGIDGKVLTNFNDGQANAIALQSDGKIVVAGYSYDSGRKNFAVMRYNIDGSYDYSFDSDGKLLTAYESYESYAIDLVIQTDGKIVVAGNWTDGTFEQCMIVRYNIDGSRDNSFDGDGIFTRDNRYKLIAASALAIQSDGKIVIGGQMDSAAHREFIALRFNVDGSLDNSFNLNGMAHATLSSKSDFVRDVNIQADGKIILAGNTPVGIGFVKIIALVRFNKNGVLDSSFSNDGILTTNIGTSNWTSKLLIQKDGKIIAAGTSLFPTPSSFALIRYYSDGSIDSSFGINGIVITSKSGYHYNGNSATLQSDGKIVVVGLSRLTLSSIDYTSDIALVRYNSNTSSIPQINKPQIKTTIYPNPIVRKTTLYSELALRDATLILKNIAGQSIKVIENLNGQTFQFDRENIPGGIYFLNLIMDDQLISTHKLIIYD